MTFVDVYSVLGMDLSDPKTTEEVAKRIPACDESGMILDFSGCIVDYPATSAVLDVAFERLDACKPKRNLILRFNINFDERMFIKWFFFGSQRLDLQQKIATDAEIRQKLLAGLGRLSMHLKIEVHGFCQESASVVHEYGQ